MAKLQKLLWVLLVLSQTAYGFPYRLQRFILTDPFGRVLKKSIDILFDTHVDLRHPKKNFYGQCCQKEGQSIHMLKEL